MGSDIRDIEAARLGAIPELQLAFEIFCYRVVKYIGAYMAVMGGGRQDHLYRRNREHAKGAKQRLPVAKTL